MLVWCRLIPAVYWGGLQDFQWKNGEIAFLVGVRKGRGGISVASGRGGREQRQTDLRETLPIILKVFGKGKAILVLPSQHWDCFDMYTVSYIVAII